LLQQYSAQQSDARQLTRELEAQQRLPHRSYHVLDNLFNSSSPSIMSNPQHSTPHQAPTPTMQAPRPLQANHVPGNVPNPSSPAATVNPDRFNNHTQFPFPTVRDSRQLIPGQVNNVLNAPNPASHDSPYSSDQEQPSAPTVDAGATQPTIATTTPWTRRT
ncbi:hypothetical protein CMUS01_03886, partial [Colletotrichum musicola]